MDSTQLVSTYSIVARDPRTGDLGAGVQSHYFRSGGVVPWAESGVGVVATQAFAEVSYGPKGLALLREGMSPDAALAALLAADPGRDVRQLAMVDAQGRVAVHTGARCIAAAGSQTGVGYSTQGNMLRSDAVWQAMPQAFERAEGDLADRLLAALEAAEAAGGDVRGRQAAALFVVSGKRSEAPWDEWKVELRVDDHPEPLVELRRLLRIQRAYDRMTLGRVAIAAGNLEAADEEFLAAQNLYPENPEFGFWAGVGFGSRGDIDRALRFLRPVYARDPSWRELLRRLPAAGLFPNDRTLIDKLTDD
jgi:uncharacterized Ntn-hydrolase superfamily protein